MSAALALDARGLVRRFGPVTAVDHADVSVEPGELVALLGPSGCGKSTTLRLIAGLDTDGEGTIDIDGTRVTGGRRPVPPEARGVGLVFQDNVLFPHLSVAGNVGYGIRRGDRAGTVARMIDLLGLARLADRMPHEISGGEQQRTALARTLAASPGLVLLDEPFSHLDANLREQVRGDMLLALERTESSALLVTHDQAEALAVADRVLVMRAGRIHQSGAPREVYRHPADRFVAEFLGRAALVPVRVTGRHTAESALGALALADEPASGPRLAVLRPESLAFVGDGLGVPARVVRVVFQGRDELVHVELDEGTALAVASTDAPRTGARVNVAVRGAVATVADDRMLDPSVADAADDLSTPRSDRM
ncbi:ABC transporter ATP-binding protein [Agromyces atrinae]|uniref:ABC-type quaternary amine transporter n=1 Tax=Agromyces atrinae TaxID=592376 RepID=A0A4Q2M8P9_9MICO|nr:ABC transporter ATP-binding protein [Agromyces atrinae]NYD68095.1 iron(III) transport system ATP-binding protein [Agromyces atrinae]RXZ87757.1 ABC transporter ATP-binding protein [Agromyces atrinae]